MIRKNIHSNNGQTFQEKSRPFLLKPAGKEYLWGGTRLKDDFGKEIPLEVLAETWECSVHPDGLSMVVSGQHAGKSLQEVLRECPRKGLILRQEQILGMEQFLKMKTAQKTRIIPEETVNSRF